MSYLIIIFPFVIGISAILASWKLVRLYFKIGGWDRVEAKVISKEVVYSNLSSSPKTPYTILVDYTYNYNNKEYRGTKLDLVELIGGFSSYGKPEAEMRMEKIKEKAMIYVNPNDQAQSIMNRSGVTLYLIIFVIGIFSVLYGVLKLF